MYIYRDANKAKRIQLRILQTSAATIEHLNICCMHVLCIACMHMSKSELQTVERRVYARMCVCVFVHHTAYDRLRQWPPQTAQSKHNSEQIFINIIEATSPY